MARWLLAIVALATGGGAGRAQTVALTFDDLPVLGKAISTDAATKITHKLLMKLQRNRLPAIGFVNENKLEGFDRARRVALLSAWLDAGMDLGNHTYSHLSLTSSPLDAYIIDVERGETVTRFLLAERGQMPRWFRHPYLETGPTLAVRQQFEDWLAAHGYRVAPVTMENTDWLFALPYDDAILRRDRKQTRYIREHIWLSQPG